MRIEPAAAGQVGRIERRLLAEILLIFAAAVLLMAPSLLLGLPNGDSVYLNVNWYDSFRSQMAAGEPYPRFLGQLWGGAGGMDFYFYPPLAFCVTAAVELLACPGCGPDRALALSGVAMLAASGVAFRQFALRHVGRPAALAGALLYMALPYHLGADWVDRQAIGEFLVFALVPMHLAAVTEGLAGRLAPGRLALWTALICLTHLPTLIVLGVFYLALAALVVRPASAATLAGTVLAGLLGLGLAGVYLVPALLLLDSVNPELLRDGPVQWRDFLLTPENWQAQRPFFREIWIEFAAIGIAALSAAALSWRSRPLASRLIVTAFAVALLMNLPLSAPLWSLGPVATVQFGFRFLLLTDLAAALATALLVERLIAQRQALPALLLALIGITAATDLARAFPDDDGGREWRREVRSGAVEWMAKRPAGQDGGFTIADLRALAARPAVAISKGSVRVLAERPRELLFRVSAEQPVEIVVRRSWWRHWRLVRLEDGVEIAHRPVAGFPLLTARLPAGEARYRLHLPTLLPEWIGLALTLVSLAAAGLWARRRRAG